MPHSLITIRAKRRRQFPPRAPLKVTMINLTTGKEVIPSPDSLTISELLEGMRETHERFKAIAFPAAVSSILGTHQSIKAIMAPITGVSTMLATRNSLTDIINPPGGIAMLAGQKSLAATIGLPAVSSISMLATLNGISAIATPNPIFASLVARAEGIQSALNHVFPNGFSAHIYKISGFYGELLEIRKDPKRWKAYLKQFPLEVHSRKARTLEAEIIEQGEAVEAAVIASNAVLGLVCAYAVLIDKKAVTSFLKKVFAKAETPLLEYLPAKVATFRNGFIKEKGLTDIAPGATAKALTARIEAVESALQIIGDFGLKCKNAARADLKELKSRLTTC